MEFIIVSNLCAHMLNFSIKCESCLKGLSAYRISPQPEKEKRVASFLIASVCSHSQDLCCPCQQLITPSS